MYIGSRDSTEENLYLAVLMTYSSMTVLCWSAAGNSWYIRTNTDKSKWSIRVFCRGVEMRGIAALHIISSESVTIIIIIRVVVYLW